MMRLKSPFLVTILCAGFAAAGIGAPAWAEQRRGDEQHAAPSRGDDQRREAARGNPRRFEQDAARRAMLDGHVMPFSVIKRRVERDMDGASYVGSEFDDRRGEYRLKYMMDGRVLWVDVDGRSGDIVRRSR